MFLLNQMIKQIESLELQSSLPFDSHKHSKPNNDHLPDNFGSDRNVFSMISLAFKLCQSVTSMTVHLNYDTARCPALAPPPLPHLKTLVLYNDFITSANRGLENWANLRVWPLEALTLQHFELPPPTMFPKTITTLYLSDFIQSRESEEHCPLGEFFFQLPNLERLSWATWRINSFSILLQTVMGI
jgi:hypothetical protein